MHYSSTAFGGGNTTIKSKDPSVTQLGQRVGLSALDIQQADALYECNGLFVFLLVTKTCLPSESR